MNLDEYENAVAAACLNPTLSYPANHFAFRHVLQAISEPSGLSLVEIGVGAGGAIPLFVGNGFTFAGFDRDPSCVETSRASLVEVGQDPDRILHADLEDPQSYAALPGAGAFDVLIAMGVLPHVTSVRQGLLNAMTLVRPGGHLFIEFRNALFSLVTFNRYTREFIVDRLLSDASADVRNAVDSELAQRLNLAIPGGEIHPESFHVPFDVVSIAHELGLQNSRIIPFHFHAGMPAVESDVAQSYRLDSVALEDDESGWKGLFLASAFLLHAQRPE
jgi:2-polyprenyl-3-methyl-5-hydroxy-6-metoxy-1,4-benzoquinol methylase